MKTQIFDLDAVLSPGSWEPTVQIYVGIITVIFVYLLYRGIKDYRSYNKY